MDKTDVVDALSTVRALLAEPTLGLVQALEVHDSLVAKIEAVLEHRRMLVEVRTLVLHHAQDQIAQLPTEIRDQLDATARSSRACVVSTPSIPASCRRWPAPTGCRG